jgi:hypothetical protein
VGPPVNEPGMSHDELAELLGAFALDAVDEPEAELVRTHLAHCPRCRDEVHQLQQAAAMLASTGGDAPPGIWDAIESRLRPPGPVDAVAPPVDARLAQLVRAGRRRRIAVRIATGLAAAAAAAIAVLGVEVDHLSSRLSHVAVAAARADLFGAARSALLDPTARRIVLKTTAAPTTVAAELVIERSGASYLFNDRLAPLPSNETYQLWAVVGERAISVGLLGPRPTTVAIALDASMSADAFALTAEPAGGTPEPTHPPVAVTS